MTMVERYCLFAAAILVAGCGLPPRSANTPGPSSSLTVTSAASPAISGSPIPSSAPSGATTARQAGTLGVQQFAAATGRVYVPGASCPGRPCVYGEGKETDGDHAAYFVYAAASGDANGPGPIGCYIYVYEAATGWYYLNGYCTQNLVVALRGVASVHTPGSCTNLRQSPGLSGTLIRCLKDGTSVTIDDGPNWVDKHMWWHVDAGGWIAHDSLF